MQTAIASILQKPYSTGHPGKREYASLFGVDDFRAGIQGYKPKFVFLQLHEGSFPLLSPSLPLVGRSELLAPSTDLEL